MSTSRELVDGCSSIRLPGSQQRRREVGVVGGVGVVLGFEAEAEALDVGCSAVAGEGSVEEVSAVELDSGLGGHDFHVATGLGLVDSGDLSESAAAQDPVVVVSAAEDHLLVVGVDAFGDDGWLSEVEGGSFDGHELSGWDELGRDGGDVVAEDLHLVSGVILGFWPFEVEVGVVRQVDVGCLVGGCSVVDFEFVFRGERVGHRDFELAGVALIAVGRGEVEDDAGVLRRRLSEDLPHHFVEALGSAVERVGPVVDGERILFAVDFELPFRDSVAESADGAAEVGALFWVRLKFGESEGHFAELSGAVGSGEGDDGCAVIHDLGDHSVLVLESVKGDWVPFEFTEFCLHCGK